jgi:hypothetical protein
MAQLSGLSGAVSGPVVPPVGAPAVAAPAAAAAAATPAYIFTATGDKIQAAVVNTGLQLGQDVAIDAAGNATIVWTDGETWSDGLDSSATGIYGRRFDAAGKPLGGQFRVNSRTENQQESPVLGLDGQGRAVVVYRNAFPAPGENSFYHDVRVQRMNLDGSRGAELIIPRSGSDRTDPATQIRVEADGSFTVAFWAEGNSVVLQRYDASNKLVTSYSMSVAAPFADGERGVSGWNSDSRSGLRLGPDGSVYQAWAALASKRVPDVGTQTQGRVQVSRLGLNGTLTRKMVYESPWETVNADGSLAGLSARFINGNGPWLDVCPLADGGYFWGVRMYGTDPAKPGDAYLAVEKRSAAGAVVTPLAKVTKSGRVGEAGFTRLPDGNVLLSYVDYTGTPNGSTLDSVKAGQLLSSAGVAIGEGFPLGLASVPNGGSRVAVAPSGGRIAVTWQNERGGGWYSNSSNGVPLVYLDKGLPNKAPSAVRLANTITTLPENTSTASRVKVADIVITDDTQGTNTISLSGGDAGSFEVVGTSLFLRAGVGLNFESKKRYWLDVNASDASLFGSVPVSAAFVLAVSDVNEAPHFVNLSNWNIRLPEDTSTASRVKVADIVITDDALGTNTISLSGADAGSFEVIGTSLFLRAGVGLNFEAKKYYSVMINVKDATLAYSVEKGPFTLSLKNVDDSAPTITSAAVATAVNENSGVNQIVYTATATDSADISGGFSFSLGGADKAAFSIDAATGVVRLLANPDFETKPAYSFAVLATDKAQNASSLPVTLKINNVNEAPTIKSSATVSVFENRSSVMTVVGADPEAAKVSYRIVGGADAAKFTINATTGALAFKAAPNFEAPTDAGADNTYQVAVQVSDGSLTSPVQTMNVGVLNVNEPPVGAAKTIMVARNASYTFTASDFGFRDPGDKTPNALKAVRIASLPTRGSLKKDGVAVKVGDLITAADITAGKLRFTPVVNTSGMPYASFKFQVQDDGGVLNGGVDTDPVTKVMTMHVR